MSYFTPDRAGRPYYPSNGTEGEWFTGQWCERCLRHGMDDADGGCNILALAMMGNVDEWVHDAEGKPTCTAFEEDSDSGRAKLYREQVEQAGQQRLPTS